MPSPYPEDFRRDVVAIARKGEAPLPRIAKGFGISISCLQNWLEKADIEDGTTPGVTRQELIELREAKKRIRDDGEDAARMSALAHAMTTNLTERWRKIADLAEAPADRPRPL
ncbi:hypothetical protein GFY24_39600 [Nocardia sp. SYP-A9097]|uniref:hypothetical protein n=1 Tax=Nocardia sp. SYP-A9097 TaxID=2663237 RepID=UPI00129BA19E|nr:hypothetical protein [Nocardia sp. SYP-A9097]MRH93446.1 hypothetical protein [Nocardia sp. SYP-A9097]